MFCMRAASCKGDSFRRLTPFTPLDSTIIACAPSALHHTHPLPQGEPKSSATGSSARELELPGQLRSMEVQDWAQYLAGGLNAPDLISRVALLPQVRRGREVCWRPGQGRPPETSAVNIAVLL